ncbi:MAG TPA: hypothetical protein VJQ56_04125 [Blastocatellia bacterium]|nr:hypothetical protein [Blastocatellia bacterium]
MTPNRLMSLNEVTNDFSVEELEPRMEMQMLGLGADPGIIIIRRSPATITITVITGTLYTTSGTWYFT